MATTRKSKHKTASAKRSAGKPTRKAAARSASPRTKVSAKPKPKPITIKPKSKSGRKPLTIKTPTRASAKSSAQGRTVVSGNGIARGGKGARGGLTDAEKNSLIRNKKTRTVVEAASEVKADAKGYVFINGRRVRMITVKARAPVKKTRAPSSAQKDEEARNALAAIRKIKTKLSRKELNHYRELLLQKRRELAGDLTAMEDQALRSGGGNLSHMPIHMADIGSDTFDQDFTLKIAETERQQLREIDGALQRIADGTYGVCQLTGKPIPKARLEAKPWAKYTVESARIIESQWGR